MRVSVAFCYENHLYYGILEENCRMTIGSGSYDTMQVAGLPVGQFSLMLNTRGVFFSGKYPYEQNNLKIQTEQVIPMNRKHRMFMYISTIVGDSGKKTRLPYEGVVTLGRADNCMIKLGLGFISRNHMEFVCRDGLVYVRDCGSTNGTYVNGRLVVGQQLIKLGDVVSCFSLRIAYLNNELVFENCKGYVKIGNIPGVEDKVEKVEMENGLIFHRSPRIQSKLPTEPIMLASPPNKGPQFQESRNSFLQLLSTGAMFATSMLMGAASPIYMAARGIGLIMPVANMARQKKNDAKRKAQLEEYERLRKELYSQYIEDQRNLIQEVAGEQRRILQEENPSIELCLQMVKGIRRNLWERTARDRDFLDIRLGMGYDELCVPIKSNISEHAFQMEQDEMRQLTREIIEENQYVDYIPTRVQLKRYTAVGVLGQRRKVINQVRNMIIALCATHFYEDVKIVGVFDETERELWEPLKWIPHTWDNEKQSRFLAFNLKEAEELCNRMNDILEYRKRNLPENSYKEKESPLPHFIFIIGSKRYVKDSVIMKNLLLNRLEMGVSSIFMFNDMYELPKECEYILEMDGEYPCCYERGEYNARRLYEADGEVSIQAFDQFARTMSAIRVDGFAEKADIPDCITFLQGFGVKTVEQLEVDKRWNPMRDGETLAAPIGMMAGGRIFSLDAYETGHGPHGLVAGTTGAGKSELVQSWLLSMAVNYHPHDVAFVLVDYKGGGMSGQFGNLPHVIGEITNIGSGIERAFQSLEGENERREILFNRYGVSDIKQYHKLYRRGEATEILPQLVIVVDEFAIMKKEKPDSIARLIKIATVGRSLGMHLLLATQKPSGVIDDQIRTNARFSLCLKVASPGDSREVLGTADAANIRSVGRAYVKIGNHEYYELLQSFWSGAPYRGASGNHEDSVNRVRVVATDGTRIRTAQNDYTRIQTDDTELKAVVRYIEKTAQQMGISKVDNICMPELPEQLPINDLGVDCGFDGEKWNGTERWLRIPVGMYDAPRNQMQGVQYIDFQKNGHLGIYGASQTGKTTLLHTIMYSLGKYFTPEDVHIYGLDFGGGSTNVFAQMPHVGGIARSGENEKIQKLVNLVMVEFDRRNEIFDQYNVTSLKNYREAFGKEIPALVLVIDNITALIEQHEDLENFLTVLGREGRRVGIYLILTANSSSAAMVKHKIQSNITNMVAFELTDRAEGKSMMNLSERFSLPSIRGRAYVKGEPSLVTQIAVCQEGETEFQRAQNLKEHLEKMNACWDGVRPANIPIMPKIVKKSDMLANYKDIRKIPLGISYETIEPAYAHLAEMSIFLVTGGVNSGKSHFLEMMIETIRAKDVDTPIYILDSTRQSLAEGRKNTTAYCVANDTDNVTKILEEVIEEMKLRHGKIKNGEVSSAADFKKIFIVLDDFVSFLEENEENNQDNLLRICKKGYELGVCVLLAGRMADIDKLKDVEYFTQRIVQNENCIVLSGAMMNYTFLENTLSSTEKAQELQDGEAWLYEDKNCIKIKPMS